MMMPLQVTILPNYIGLRDIGLIDTRLGILLQGKIKRAFTKALMYGIITSMKGEIYKVISCGNVI